MHRAVAYVKSIKEIDYYSLELFLSDWIAHFKVPTKIWKVGQKTTGLG
ncbi:hypothetical protein C427_1929 [Paraglaciecola psychrophila 170]|uniref:Uncharacterized protein n=1 Tax=Paraglaciecola psychrophila 170 TaxID=1129794 RepID=K7A2K3_9ALTE|nr:hypothetical protein C427_1929 [Paraglaciecola psychrophila 170]GAC36612.1 hypothetical protein GPSY_0974 [Paraglaciecola psychrophila 170]